ncbi:hypothetical protein SAMN05216251_11016 [Actinacidiphila alni]|uniref:Uncharacterized protein n=1 Tax=Actinacidiphila alni TaxID=380248 RepID=A0A1I2H1K7_9ACTN|nr:hypothetical protein [Actinacidiphila alni]SFF23418.1 hypothetical protein SAMN05216251_11016 [Actinacidiphila alni]
MGTSAAVGASHTIDLRLPAATVRALTAGGFRLCLMHAVRCDTADGVPLVWATTSAYAPTTELTWSAVPYGYAATGRRTDGSPGGARDVRQVAPGQVLDVAANALTSIDPLPGDPRLVTVRSTGPTAMACGAAEVPPDGAEVPAPYCCFPLYAGTFVFLAPVPRVALAFTALPLAAGTAVNHLPGPAVLADVGGIGPVSLMFDIDKGWSWSDPRVGTVPLNGLSRALILPSG